MLTVSLRMIWQALLALAIEVGIAYANCLLYPGVPHECLVSSDSLSRHNGFLL